MIKKLPKSLRKFLRKEKSRVRREFTDFSAIQKEIGKLRNKFEIKKKKN